jgi:ectoine hydroxylase-related dioxygenase (phytanoyl-CoA dioxygenase family)
MNSLRRIVRKCRRIEVTWRYFFNLAPTLTYLTLRPPLSPEVSRVVAELNTKGVALTTVEALLGDAQLFNELADNFNGLRREAAREVDQARGQSAARQKTGEKGFLFEYLGRNPPLSQSAIYARFALDANVLATANAYFGMHTRLRYYNIWQTFASQGAPRESQLWHRDREDRFILKVFVYLTDVDEEAGPFTYVPGTHGKGPVKGEPECFMEGGVRRSSDDQIARLVPREHWVKATGPRGTVVLADTRGFHKGGLSIVKDRIMYTAMFTSPASESEEFWLAPVDRLVVKSLSHAFALAAPKRGPWLSWSPKCYSTISEIQ